MGLAGLSGSSLSDAISSVFSGNKGKRSKESKQARTSVSKNQHGKVASNLKGLNAAHASQTARLNASPNSRVGKIAGYQEATISEIGLTDQIAALNEQVDDTVATTAEFVAENISEDSLVSPEEITEAIDALDPAADDYQSDVDAIAAAMSGLDPNVTENEQALAEVSESIDSTVAAQDAQAELAENIAELEGDLDESKENQVAAAALSEAYAPHDVDDLTEEAIAELNSLLGLDESSDPEDVTTE
ncbi:hypothetical protein C1J05_11875 [Sulfitobacter sp. JL08]|nr:hypothetical protein C1J05_11875 [Sulfitobacter sp. JL08]